MTALEIPLEVEALVLATLAKRVKQRQDMVKAELAQRYADGQKDTFRSPLDESKLGIVYRTDPEPSWQVTDSEALHAELRTYPGAVETVAEIVDEQAAIEVLSEHAPHLLALVTRVRQDVVDAALEQSRESGQPAAAGITRVKPGGSLVVKPDPKAAAVVERLVAAGVISWDGRPALQSGEDAA